MIEGLYIFFANGQLLIQRNYRSMININDLKLYVSKYIKTKRFYEHPIVEINNVFFLNVSINEIVITALTKNNANVCLIFNFIHKFIEILNYFFDDEISRINIVNNFVLIYDICDEIIDYGYPQMLEIGVLKKCLQSKVKYYSRTSQYFHKLSNEFKCGNSLIEDIIHDTNLQNKSENLHKKYYNFNDKGHNSNNNKKIDDIKKMNSYEISEKNKLKNIGKEALNRIKNKIINNITKPTNNFNYMTGNCTWRTNNIYHKKNEIIIDILEVLNVTINNNNLIYAHINGKIILKCLLSGMPICELSTNNKFNLLNNKNETSIDGENNASVKYNEKKRNNETNYGANNISEDKKNIIIDNCIFHHCVNSSKYNDNKIITFTPPDGDFELMRYTVTKNIQIPFHILAIYNPVFQYSKSLDKNYSLKKSKGRNLYDNNKNTNKFEYKITIRSNYSGSMNATDVVIKIPIYKFSENVHVVYKSIGKTEFNNIENVITWKISKFPSLCEHTIKIYLTLENQNQIYSNMNNTQKVDEQSKVVLHVNTVKNMNTVKFLNTYKMPITLNFKIPMFTSSGMFIRYLKVYEKSNYKIIKWIKYLTESGAYQYK
ncbi:AP-2 complex subunit mu, putative [Plasmodium berghei]|uniref:AP-2 complex subunit mu, putative n=2 Tax=Plasmodium berghei TaxID=5821 RepID=A0A509AV99_PLABA|nr:AP-2 complex subunit mu, putative [Plasmodium berghei ANKA]CXJ20762.1 AP-2 complex subunit mu, putative [Plasmodium berghei]SCM26557.1 AP-2 complex subunit mu, putative [Plasmodium berghei]SCN28518.1 AP-2 complex subunit mu, putative [Plasmodium berghei]SCO62708.1 AP-2 complex subunit mu, putative [Plasmodium berghei]SCO64269.1 AP-2 complex subunit mu, putative [Plasmodium berghei]|eukprot:XP_034424164.1 AP-2 complex subunit mu, putative [Plasmodium berghei ANKA]